MKLTAMVGAQASIWMCACGFAQAAAPVTVDWSRQIGTPSADLAFSISRDVSGNLFLGGVSAGDAFVTKYDSGGTFLWSNPFGTASQDRVNNVATDVAGNAFAAGATGGSLFATNPQPPLDDVIVRKYDPAGSVAWSRQFGGLRDDAAAAVSTDAAGNAYVAGYLGVSIGISDAFVAKYSPTGTQLWLRQFGAANSDDVASAVKVDAAGNVIVAGRTSGALGSPSGGYDAYVRKYDPDGNALWTTQVGSSRAENLQGVTVDAVGNVYAVGQTQGVINGTTPGSFDDFQAYLFKLSAAGNFAWSRQLDQSDEDHFNEVALDAAGNAYLAGGGLLGSNQSFLLASYDPTGALRWSQSLDTPYLVDRFSGITVNADGTRAWLSGYTYADFASGVNPGMGNEDAILVAVTVPEPASVLALAVVALVATLNRRVTNKTLA